MTDAPQDPGAVIATQAMQAAACAVGLQQVRDYLIKFAPGHGAAIADLVAHEIAASLALNLEAYFKDQLNALKQPREKEQGDG